MATASTGAVGGQGRVIRLTHVNRCSVVSYDRQKVLICLNQKVSGQVQGLTGFLSQMQFRRRMDGA
ncbi:MAG: hypothetical protein GY795_26475 [Desulfobacterales bacterium]|nr:hypothetical protein [Desulfobacterales bacterium]